jgi:hypothetical protein
MGPRHAPPPLFCDAHRQPIFRSSREFEPERYGKWKWTTRLGVRHENHARARPFDTESEPSHDARPGPEPHVQRSTGNPHGVHHDDGEDLRFCKPDGRTLESFERRTHDQEPPQSHTGRNDSWPIEGVRWIHERAPGNRSAVSQGLLLSGATRRERERGRYGEPSANGQLHHLAAREPSVRQDRVQLGGAQRKDRQHPVARISSSVRNTGRQRLPAPYVRGEPFQEVGWQGHDVH